MIERKIEILQMIGYQVIEHEEHVMVSLVNTRSGFPLMIGVKREELADDFGVERIVEKMNDTIRERI